MKKLICILFGAAALAANAVTIEWWQEILDEGNMAAPKVIHAYHGERLDLRCGLKRKGVFFNVAQLTCKFYWQTPGMGDQFWSANVTPNVFANSTEMNFSGQTLNDKVLLILFTPQMDTGADTVNCFFGVTSGTEQQYRAHFVIKFHGSPGPDPAVVQLPTKQLDFNTTTVLNAPYYTKAEMDSYLLSSTGLRTAVADFINERIDMGVLMSKTAVTNWVGSNVDIKKYVRTRDFTLGSSYGNDREWRIGENDGVSVAKVLRFRNNQKIRVSMEGYPMEFYSPNWYHFYKGTASPYEQTYMSRLTPDGTPVQTQGSVMSLIRTATNALARSIAAGQTSSVDEAAITAATNALAAATTAEISAATNAAIAEVVGVLQYATPFIVDAATNAAAEQAAAAFAPKKDFFYGLGQQEQVGGVEYAEKAQTALEIDKVTRLDNDGGIALYRRRLTFDDNDGSKANGGRVVMRKYESGWKIAETNAWLSDVWTRNESDAKFYPKSQGDAWATYWDGDEVRVTVTNYYGATDLPHLYLEQRTNETGAAKYKIVWDEHTRWRKFVGNGFDWDAWSGFHIFKTNTTATLAQKADRAWGFYDSHAGTFAPAEYTSVSSSNVMIAAGLAYQRTVTTGGAAVWVLTATEPTTVSGAANGAFQIKDADGNVQVEIVKGDKRTVGARCGGVSVSGASLIAEYAMASAEHPTLEVCTDLANPTWKAEDAAGCPATVSWSGSSGAWVATVTPNAGATAVFVKGSYQVSGDSVFKSNVAMKFTQLVIGTTTYNIGTATVSGNTVLTLTQAP